MTGNVDQPSTKSWFSKHFETIKPLAFFLLGMIIGPIIKIKFDEWFRLETKILILATIGTIIIAMLAIYVSKKMDSVNSTVKSKVDEIKEVSQHSSQAVAAIADHLQGASVRIVKYGEGINQNSIRDYFPLIQQAKSILVLDSYPWTGPLDSELDSDLVSWYEELDKFIDQGKSYTRILQSSAGKSETLFKEDIRNQAVLNHFCHILESSRKSNPKAFLRCSEVLIPSAVFLIIDHRYVIWEVPMKDPKIHGHKTGFHFSMDFFMDDPAEKIVHDMLTTWNTVHHFSDMVKEIKTKRKSDIVDS